MTISTTAPATRRTIAIVLAACSVSFASVVSGAPDARNTEAKCPICKKTHDDLDIVECPACGRSIVRGASYLIRGDDFCSKRCALWYFFPDEGELYSGQEPLRQRVRLWKGTSGARDMFRDQASRGQPLRLTNPHVGRAKIQGIDWRQTKLPDGYPAPYLDPDPPKTPMRDHPVSLEALYLREQVRRQIDSKSPVGSAGSHRLVYQSNHESRVHVYRIRRDSDGGRSLDYPRYPWNDDGTLLVVPPQFGLPALAGDGSALASDAVFRMRRNYLYMNNLMEHLRCDWRVPSFSVRSGEHTFTCGGPNLGPDVIEAGGSHGEHGWTPAPDPRDSVFYWPVSLDPYTVGNLGGAIYGPENRRVYCLGMQGWLVRPAREPTAIRFYEGPYISHESLAYYHGPADRYPGFDRNRIAVMTWWAPPKLREYRIYDGDGRLIRTRSTGSDRVHIAWGDHGNFVIGDSSYDWQHPGTMTIFFPDTGAIRPIGYHDNAYWGSRSSEHPHPAVSPDGTKVLLKVSHMRQLHGLEIMVVSPPRAPIARLDKGRLTWHVPEVNSEIAGYRIFRSDESGRGFQFVAETADPRHPRQKLDIRDEPHEISWPIPTSMQGYFLVCSVEGSGLMSPPSNEVAVEVAGTRRLFVPVERTIAQRRSAYIAPDGDAASWAVVRQTEVERREGEPPLGAPDVRWTLPTGGPWKVFARARGRGEITFGQLGTIDVNSDRYSWHQVGTLRYDQLNVELRLDANVRLDQLCASNDSTFAPSGVGPLELKPTPPTGVRIQSDSDGTVRLRWKRSPEPFVKEYNVYAVPDDEDLAQRWRLCTVKAPQAVDWNVPSGPIRYAVTAVSWNRNESEPSEWKAR